MKRGGMLVVTTPSQIKKVDNVQLLQDVGFNFLEGIDVDLATGKVLIFAKTYPPAALSRIGHYSALLFTR
jgi:hypothetical protein